MSNRKVVSELSKLWESVVAKGKLTRESKVSEIKNWIAESPALTSFQSTISNKYDRLSKFQKDTSSNQISATEYVAESAKEKVGRLVSAYEEFIGIREVKNAHERVLLSEAKFMECQERRRQASRELSEIYNRLLEIRTELDRTNRGDETYLELIKQEIGATKQEKITRKHFEDLERTEREVFSELSSALRSSHEKEREQNEKTKYWSVIGSILGAGLGILGATVNNRIRQNHIKHILEATSSQVATIQSTVENLVQNINQSSLTSDEVTRILDAVKSKESDAENQVERLTKAMQESIKILQQLIVTNPSYRDEPLPTILYQDKPSYETELKKIISEYTWPLTAATCCAIYAIYRLM